MLWSCRCGQSTLENSFQTSCECTSDPLQTVLSDQIRRKTYRSLNSSEALVLSIYLDYDSRRRQTVEHCLRHLLRQIVSHSSVPPIGEVKRQHDITMSTGEQPTLGDLTNLLKSVLTHFQTVYIIVDGLEEVDKNIAAELQYELVQVRKDVKAVKIRLAFFSRNEPAERTRGMGRFCDTGSGHRYVPSFFFFNKASLSMIGYNAKMRKEYLPSRQIQHHFRNVLC